MHENKIVYLRQPVSILAAGAACIELYSIFETILCCTFNVPFTTAKHSALWLSVFVGATLRFPAAYGLYYHNTLFKPPRESAAQSTADCLRYTEQAVDVLAALAEGGLTFESMRNLLSDCDNPTLQYSLSSFAALLTVIAVFGVNKANRCVSFFEKDSAASTPFNYYTFELKKVSKAQQVIVVGLFSLLAAAGYLCESLYDSEGTWLGFKNQEDNQETACASWLSDFEDRPHLIFLMIMGVLACLGTFKAAVIEGVHVKKHFAEQESILEGCKYFFPNVSLGAGGVLASLVDVLPSMAALASIPLNNGYKILLWALTLPFVGMSSMFVAGQYWQGVMQNLVDIFQGCSIKKEEVSIDEEEYSVNGRFLPKSCI